jgi:polar amino acid transport system permease protein
LGSLSGRCGQAQTVPPRRNPTRQAAHKLQEIKLFGPGFVDAAWTVLWLTVATIVFSWICGLAAALAHGSKWCAARMASAFHVWFIRGTPTLIQIFIIYFGLPAFGVRLSPFAAGALSLGINSGAYVAEIMRSIILPQLRGSCDLPSQS